MTRLVGRGAWALLVCAALAPSPAMAAERWTIGLTTNGAPIEALVVDGLADAPTVLLVGGLGGSDRSGDAVRRAVTAFEAQPQNRRPFRLIAIPAANPDAQPLQFPPTGAAYRDNTESHVLWRWIGIHAPDLVLVAGAGRRLASALSQNALPTSGSIPARRVAARHTDPAVARRRRIPTSDAHRELDRRQRPLASRAGRANWRRYTVTTSPRRPTLRRWRWSASCALATRRCHAPLLNRT